MAVPRDVAEALVADAATLRRLAAGLLGRDHVDDVVQASFATALSRRPSSLRHPGLWLRGTLRRLAWRSRRTEKRRLERERLVARPELDQLDPATLAMQAEAMRELGAAVHELDEPFRTTVVLRFWHDLGIDAITGRLGVPRNTVRSRLQRGLTRLRERLDAAHRGRDQWAAPLAAMFPARSAAVASATLFTGILMKTKLLLVAAAAVLGAIAVPVFLHDNGLVTGEVAAEAPATLAPTLVPSAAEERREAPALESPKADSSPAAEEPARTGPWFARFLAVEEQHHQPVADAIITLWEADRMPNPRDVGPRYLYGGRKGEALFTLRTDALGRASVHLGPDHCVAQATSPGFADTGDVQLWAPTAEQRETVMVLKIPSKLRGIVLRADGSPAAGAMVTVRTTSIRRFRADIAAGEDGHFEAAVTDDGYEVSAELEGARTFREQVWVRPGRDREVLLQFPGAFTLAGEVVDAAGKDMAGVRVNAWREFHPDRTMRTDPDYEREGTVSRTDGHFQIPVRRLARYQIVAAGGELANSELVWTETTAAEPHPFTRLQLRPFTTITGVLRSDRGDPVGGRLVSADPETELSPGSACSPSSSDAFVTCKPVTTGADGRFSLRVQPGVAWKLTAYSMGSLLARVAGLSHVQAGTDVQLVVPEGRLQNSTVHGRVVRAQDSSPVDDFTVWMALLEDDRPMFFRPCKPVRNGSEFVLPALPAGCRYVLQVQPDVTKFEKTQWAAVRLEPFTTSAATTTELDIRVPDWGELPVRIVPAPGDDLRSITCGISLDIVQNRGRAMLKPDQEGRVTIKEVPPTGYQVMVTREYLKTWKRDVLVRPGLNPEVVFDLAKDPTTDW